MYGEYRGESGYCSDGNFIIIPKLIRPYILGQDIILDFKLNINVAHECLILNLTNVKIRFLNSMSYERYLIAVVLHDTHTDSILTASLELISDARVSG